MTIRQALQQRVPRVRDPKWGETTYLRLPLLPGGTYGPWAELYDDAVQQDVLHIRPGSQRICILLNGPLDLDADDAVPYTGPASPFEQHAESFSRTYAES